jgi:DNA-binding NtrC family response regulator
MNTIGEFASIGLRILHLDDDPFQLDRLRLSLSQSEVCREWNVRSVDNCPEFAKCRRMEAWDVFIVDLGLEGQEGRGLQVIRETRADGELGPIFVLSNTSHPALVAEAMLAGADDVLSKNDQGRNFVDRLHAAVKMAGDRRATPTNSLAKKVAIAGETMRQVAMRVPKIVQSAVSSVHVSGPSGAGKEIVADLFEAAEREGVPFVRVNCGALTSSVLHSELFGHVRGSFTGAGSDKRGLVETAHGGWLYLDEVACLSVEAQMALLRVLENSEVRRVGASETKRVQVRVISATNEDLAALVHEGKFRLDLWQRIQDVRIELPPLSARRAEIPELIEHFLQTLPNGPYQISAAACALLQNLNFDLGNVRELRNCLRAMTESHINRFLSPQAIPDNYLRQACLTSNLAITPDAAEKVELDECEAVREDADFEELIQKTLAGHLRRRVSGGRRTSIRRLATELRMSRTTLGHRVQQLATTGMLAQKELALVMGRI